MNANTIKKYIMALCNLYGLVSKTKVIEIYKQQNKDEISLIDLEKLLEEGLLEDTFIKDRGRMFIQDYMDEELIAFLMRQQQNKPYYIPDKKELLKYADEWYFEKTSEYFNLLKFVKSKIAKNSEEAEMMCVDAVELIRMPGAGLDDALIPFTADDVEFPSEEIFIQLVDLLVQLSNNTRLSENRGFSPRNLPITKEHFLA